MYDHGTKAGNQGDVVKHVALVAALDFLLASGRGTFSYADTFAGYALNPLTATGEWRLGIGHIERRGATSSNPHVALWRRFWSTGLPLLGSTYPGSSNFALRLARSHSRPIEMHLWDISPSAVAQLMTVYEGLPVTIHTTSATPRDLPDCDFLLVDPPGVGPNKNYPRLEELLSFSERTRAFLLWLPMVADLRQKPPPESEDSRLWRQTAVARGFHATTVRWTPAGPICGCQLIYRLPAPARSSLRSATEAAVSLTAWALHEVTHLDPP